MKAITRFVAVSAVALLTACGGGGGDSSATSPGATFSATPGVFVARGNFFLGFPQYYHVVLDDGETWIVSEYNTRGEPIFFATGKFQFAERITRNTSTTTVTVRPDSTVTETTPETLSMSSGVPVFSGNTNFKAKEALITINSNVLGISEVIYTESFRQDRLLAESVSVVSPAVGLPRFGPGFNRGKADSFLDYNQPASVQRVSGTYRTLSGGMFIDTVLAVDGTFSGTNPVSGCLFNGSLSPHPNGKNVFVLDVVLSSCQDAGNYKGIAAPFPAADLTSGSGGFDLISASGMQVTSLFLAAVDTKAGRAVSFVLNGVVAR